ncbi:A/G-specific adenine glycosylase [Microdochium nivale]|nr:A/G-specific adenine glycosylase [Microdochium nivale]
MRRSARVVPRVAVVASQAVSESPDSSPPPSVKSGSDFDDGDDDDDDDNDDDDDDDDEDAANGVEEEESRPTRKRPRVHSAASVRTRSESPVKRAAPPPPPPRESQRQPRPAAATTSSAAGPKRKKTKTSAGAQTELHKRLFGAPSARQQQSPASDADYCSLPDREHAVLYHRPLLLDSRAGRQALLSWFDGVSTARSMPWRKAWIDPFAEAGDEAALRDKLERRAYEVWISEIMLQQTRVAVVIDYWNRWTSRWPTIGDLAAASADDVLAAWRGLGYYSRATRIHEAAKLVTRDPLMRGLLPADAGELQAKVPGVGRYTGGAISAIVFGRAAPMVDGNVLRVLSRQLGLLGDVKADKANIDLLWAAADALVKAVARDAPLTGADDNDKDDGDAQDDKDWEVLPSDRPGRWGQALMELGSTVCQPKPSCDKCPITASCRAYAEGLALTATAGKKSRKKNAATAGEGGEEEKRNKIVDIEDACSMCATPDLQSISLDGGDGDDDDNDDTDGPSLSLSKKKKNGTKADKKKSLAKTKTDQKKQTSLLQAFSFTRTTKAKQDDANSSSNPADAEAPAQADDQNNNSSNTPPSAAALEGVANYARQFPLKTAKKAAREEETLVCAIRRRGPGGEKGTPSYLIQRRPDKGLLAGMWELPSLIIDSAAAEAAARIDTPKRRGEEARRFVEETLQQLPGGGSDSQPRQVRHVGELGTIPWLFSHIKLSMHVHLFELGGNGDDDENDDDASTAPEHSAGKARASRWTSTIDDESMGTGMRKCVALVQDVPVSS